tara:strand:+ start:603 stop:1250 length:648 start_codon:yes stop_codon:yes gene_type:complete
MKLKLLIMALTVTFSAGLMAADANKPHEHQGLVKPIKGAPPELKLTAADQAKLAKGEPVRKRITIGDTGGRGVVVQDIQAPKDVVMGRILDFNNYPKMVDKVKLTKNYETKGGHVKTHFIIGNFAFEMEYFIDHVVKKDKGYVTWTLDYSRNSDLVDSVGFWHAKVHPTKPGWTRLVYSAEIRLSSWVPGFVENYFAEKGLVNATAWVKKESEKR